MDNKNQSAFEWTLFYAEFANKLLSYKNNRKELLSLLETAHKQTGLKYPFTEQEQPLDDICPFTVFGSFNKGISDKNRIFLMKFIGNQLKVQAKVPSEFNGIPVLNNLKARFFGLKANRQAEDIDNLWNIFEAAIKYADNPTESTKRNFVADYDAVIKQHIIQWNLSMGLYWIRPYSYLNLDGVNRNYLTQTPPYAKGVLNISSLKQVPTAEKYLQLIDVIKTNFENKGNPHKSFPELSFEAWKTLASSKSSSVNVETASKQKDDGSYILKLRPELEAASSEYDDLIDFPLYEGNNQDNKDIRYWWLNANPRIWSFSNMAVGEEQDYTLVNDNGNKRRIYQNFLEAKKGDMVIAYESTPVKKIVAICKISKPNDGEALYFEKIENLVSPIDYKDIKGAEELRQMEYFSVPQGSLFKLSKSEYDFLMDLIRDQNPILSKKALDGYSKDDFLTQVYMSEENYDTLKSLIERKKNVILQGPPGVGKTFAAKLLAYSILEKKDNDKIKCVQFHQNYSYEDFIMGYRPTEDSFKLESGIFYKFCQEAQNSEKEKFFFIIDEINRGNLSKIFGELLMLIENSYREQKLTLALTGTQFYVPKNLYIIGMMNTADRSLGMIDYALRRRFSFFEMNPAFDNDKFKNYQAILNSRKLNILIDKIKVLNQDISKDASLGDGFRIGHSYFCDRENCTDGWLREIIEYDLIPVLKEYWFDNQGKVNNWMEELRGVLND